VMQSGISCIAASIRASPTQIAETEYEKKPIVTLICMMIVQVLNFEISDTSTPLVGELITSIFVNLPSKFGTEAITHILKATVVRLHSAEYPLLQESLLMVFARLIHTHGINALDLLASFGTLDVKVKEKHIKPSTSQSLYPVVEYKLVDSKVHAFTSVFQKWVHAQTLDIRNPYPTKVLLMALSKLLTLPTDKAVALEKIPVDGYPIVSEKKKKERKVKTRSQTKSNPLKYSQIPLSAKIVSLLLQEWNHEKREPELQDEKEKKNQEKKKR